MLNMNFAERVVIDTNIQPWLKSPRQGVWRKPLAREEAERGHATSIVKYAAGASFSQHDHPLGEEILVLEGTFSDQSGDYPKGSYFRNPEGYVHSPFSQHGCIILVKLHQFITGDKAHVCVNTNTAQWQGSEGSMQIQSLHEFHSESVSLLSLPAGTFLDLNPCFNVNELYVISGELIDDLGHYPEGVWMRGPDINQHHCYVEQDTVMWVKSGHLI